MKANCGDDLKKMRGWDRPEDGEETKANCEDRFKRHVLKTGLRMMIQKGLWLLYQEVIWR